MMTSERLGYCDKNGVSASKEMTPRERILMTLSHRESDRVPYDMGSIGPSSISIGTYKSLLAHLQLDEKPEIGDISGQRAKVSEAFLQKSGVATQGPWDIVFSARGN
jgi:hypothetical protein